MIEAPGHGAPAEGQVKIGLDPIPTTVSGLDQTGEDYRAFGFTLQYENEQSLGDS